MVLSSHTPVRSRARWIGVAAASSLLACLGAGCSVSGALGDDPGGGREPASITIKGSDTMVILTQKWAEAFMAAHPGTTVQVSGGGSGTGIASLINGTTTLANASRRMEPSETRQLEERRHARALATPVALDAIAIYVHRDNPVRALSIEQLRAIFRGQLVAWREVGPDLGPIVLYSRENNSGTYAFFKEEVLDQYDFAARAQTLPGTAAVINAVSLDPRGIGYGGIAYAEGVRLVPIATEAGPVAPTLDAALGGRYPLARSLYVYSAGEPQDVARSFLDFALSPRGQALVEGVGYYPLPAEARSATVEGAP